MTRRYAKGGSGGGGAVVGVCGMTEGSISRSWLLHSLAHAVGSLCPGKLVHSSALISSNAHASSLGARNQREVP